MEDHTALRENPDPNSRVITHVVGDFTFIRSTDQYVQVESAGNKGYINKMFIKSKDAAVGEKATELAVATKLKNYAKYVDSLGQVVKVFLYSPVTVKPTSSSRIVVYADNRKVLLLSDFNNEYCVVRIGKIRGYMNKSYLYYY